MNQRGWNRLLPIFSSYVVFYWLSTLVIWPFVFWSLFPAKIQRTVCLIYTNGSCVAGLIGLVFIIAVLYELSGATVPVRSSLKRLIGTCGFGGLILAFFFGLLGGTLSARDGFFQNFADGTIGLGILLVPALLLTLILIKTKHALKWSSAISLIVVSIAVVYFTELAASIIVYKHRGPTIATGMVVQMAGAICPILWLIAVRHSPAVLLGNSATISNN